MITEKNSVLKITAGACCEPMRAEIIAEKEILAVTFEITDKSGASCACGEGVTSGLTARIEAHFPSLEWSPKNPVLYRLSVHITYSDADTEDISDRFGFRRFDVDGRFIYLNGYPFYMRAYIRGAAAHEHQNNCRLTEYDFYKKNFVMAKSYGYNTVRFHSVIPTDECFRAADDEGMLVHIEMRAENMEYDNLQEMLYGKNDFVSDAELINIINRLYNHPSFMVYCVGNEIRQPGKKPRIREIRDFIKKHDPTRLFIDTCAHGEFDRDYVDFDVQHMGYYFPYGKNANMFSDTDNLLGFGTVRDREMIHNGEDGSKIRRGISFTRPLLAHEVCHYTSWRDYYALREKFESYGIDAPWWIDEEIKLLECKGYKDNFKKYLQITKNFQFRAWKNALEGIRASSLLSGFHMLQFADTDKYENSNGVVDCFDDPHGISTEEFNKFNADTVLLARLPKQIYSFGETVKVPVLLSQFAINPRKKADFLYRLICKECKKVLRSGTLTDVDTATSGLYSVCSLEFDIPELKKPQALSLECSLIFDDGTSCDNSWELWAFPAVEQPIYVDARLDMSENYLDGVISNDKSPLTITDKLDNTLFRRLKDGEDVMLIYRTAWTRHLLHKDMEPPEYALPAVWERYKGVIWDRGTINGGFDESDLLCRHGFVTDGEINFQYYPLIEDSDKINLDGVPFKFKSIVSGLDKASRDRFDVTKFGYRELRYEKTMRNFSYVFELAVGKGRLLVCGLNLTGIKENPSTAAMLKTLVSYCRSSEFGNVEVTDIGLLQDYLSSVANGHPNKEGMMTQYWQLDCEPVESMEYWTESERYLRDNTAK